MTNIIYQALIISCISDLEDFPVQLNEWIFSNFKEEEQVYFIAYCIVSSVSKHKNIVTEEAIDYYKGLLIHFCKETEAEFLSLFIYAYFFSLYSNSQIGFETVEESVRNWRNVISFETHSEQYSNIDFFKDLAKIYYLRSCYPVVAEHTKEVREVAIELLETKESFGQFEEKFKSFMRF